jgi:hypothetical protein
LQIYDHGMSTSATLLVAAVVLIAFVLVIRARRAKSKPVDGDVMKTLRLRVLTELPDGVGPQTPSGTPIVALMDIGFPEATASVFGASTGDASIYLSSGGGVIGGVRHENVRAAAVAFVNESGKHLNEMTATSDFSYPKTGHVRFYIRTRDAVYMTDRTENDLGEKRDALWPLFYAGQDVITQLREVAPDS